MSVEGPTRAEMARELDAMERDVTSWEASFLESVLSVLAAGRRLSTKQAKTLEEMHEKYLGEGRDDEDGEPEED